MKWWPLREWEEEVRKCGTMMGVGKRRWGFLTNWFVEQEKRLQRLNWHLRSEKKTKC